MDVNGYVKQHIRITIGLFKIRLAVMRKAQPERGTGCVVYCAFMIQQNKERVGISPI